MGDTTEKYLHYDYNFNEFFYVIIFPRTSYVK